MFLYAIKYHDMDNKITFEFRIDSELVSNYHTNLKILKKSHNLIMLIY